MTREIISLFIGGCGINLGEHVWDQFITEHKIDHDGAISNTKEDYASLCTFFEEETNNFYKSRSLFIDTELDKIDDLKVSANNNIFKDCCFATNNNPTHHNFAKAAKDALEDIHDMMHAINLKLESCDNCQGFMFYRSACGGTTGLSSSIIQKMDDNFGGKHTFCEFLSYPSKLECNSNEMNVYNMMLNSAKCADDQADIHLSFAFDNSQIRSITERYLQSHLLIPNGYFSMNEYIAKMVSSFTAPLRFDESEIASDLKYFEASLVPFTIVKHIISSRVPIEPKDDFITNNHQYPQLVLAGFCRRSKMNIAMDINRVIYQRYCAYFEPYSCIRQMIEKEAKSEMQAITCFPFKESNLSIKIEDQNEFEMNKYMAACMHYGGNIKPKHVQAAMMHLKSSGAISFIEWCPTGMRMSMSQKVTSERKDPKCIMKEAKKENTVFGNSAIFGNFIRKRMIEPYEVLDLIGHEKMHLYTQYGVECQEFDDALNSLRRLYDDYKEVVQEPSDSDEDSESD